MKYLLIGSVLCVVAAFAVDGGMRAADRNAYKRLKDGWDLELIDDTAYWTKVK